MTESKNQKSLSGAQARNFALGLLFLAGLLAFLVAPYLGPKKPLVSEKKLPDASLSLLSGGGPGDRVRFSDYRGKVVLLDFWASWCRPCREQTELLRAMAAELPRDVVILGIDGSESEAEARKFLASEPTPYSNAYDEGGEFSKSLGVTELPSLYIVDPKGSIVSEAHRKMSREEILQAIVGAKK